MKKNLIRTCVFVVCLAMVAPAFAAEDAWTGDSGTDILWSNPDNWLIGGPGPLPSIKTVIGEYNYGVPGSNDVTLAFDAGTVSGFEVFGKGILNIMPNGILTIAEGGDRGIYGILADDVGSAINLLGGTLIVENPQDMQGLTNWMYGEDGLTEAEGGIKRDTTSMPGYALYTAIPEPATMLLLGLGAFAIRRRK